MDVVFIKGFPTSIFKKFDFILSEISAFINVLDLIIFLTFNKLKALFTDCFLTKCLINFGNLSCGIDPVSYTHLTLPTILLV